MLHALSNYHSNCETCVCHLAPLIKTYTVWRWCAGRSRCRAQRRVPPIDSPTVTQPAMCHTVTVLAVEASWSASAAVTACSGRQSSCRASSRAPPSALRVVTQPAMCHKMTVLAVEARTFVSAAVMARSSRRSSTAADFTSVKVDTGHKN